MERKLAAIMAADVVGYSRMMAEDESGTYNQLRSALDEIVHPALERHGGRVFKNTGDGFLASFPSVNEALDAAVDIQNGFAACPLQLRIGLNLGDVIEEGADVFGDGVNIACRLEATARPGSIYVSAAVMRSADKNRSERFDRIGRQHLKNIPEAVEVYAIHTQRSPAAAKAKRHLWHAPRRAAATAAGVVAVVVAAGAMTLDVDWETMIGKPSQGEQSVSEAASADARPSVAVLPFDNLSGDPSQAYFTDGLTEDIITELARNGELSVIARNSTFALRERPTDIREVGARLGAGYVVEGSARRNGDRLRVVAQLIDANTGSHLWSRSYDRNVGDVFDVQTDLTAQIVASLVSYVRQAEFEAAESRPTDNLQAYDLVLRARDRYKHGSTGGSELLDARALYQRAVALDPDYAAAHAHLAMTYIVDSVENLTGKATPRDLQTGLDEAREAIRLAGDLPLGYQVLSFGLAASGDYAASMKAGERAVELNPGDPDSLMALAKAQVRFGAYEEAVGNAERARRLHPIAPQYYAYVHGQALYAAGRIGDADEVLSECLLSAPQDPNCLRIRAAVQVRKGEMNEARATMERLVAADQKFSLASETEYRRFGNSPLMDRYLAELAQAHAPKSAGDRSRTAQRAT